ncbi:MAG: hypothetical protein ABTQ29_02370 [Siculibacillus sp.]
MRQLLIVAAVVAAGVTGTMAGTGHVDLSRFGLGDTESFAVPDCDARAISCATLRRTRALAAMDKGRRDDARRLLQPVAATGDVRAMFLLGWTEEEAYRGLVGTRIKALSTIPEEARWTPESLPRGEGFDRLVADVEAAEIGEADRRRRLAWLWYSRAAIDGFAPAMNNLGAMYHYGLMGPRDRSMEELWYRRAMEAGSPIGLLNVLRTWNRELRAGTAACSKVLYWYGGGGVFKPSTREEDTEDSVMARTRFRGRGLPPEARDWLRNGSRGRWSHILRLTGVQRPAISQSEIAAFERALPEHWVFEADPDEVSGELPRFRDTVSLRLQAELCDRDSYRQSETDHSKLERVRWMQDAMDRRRR